MVESSAGLRVVGGAAPFQTAEAAVVRPTPAADARARASKARTPRISVVVPAFNAAATLAETLDSLRRQSFGDFEALVVNDGSTDATLAIAQEFARRDRRFRALDKPNGGVSSAYNRGLHAAAGEWLLFLDADDRLRPRALEQLLAAAVAVPGAGVAVGGAARLDSAGRAWRSPRFDLSEPFARLAYECAIPAIHSALVRRDLVLSLGGFDETLRTSEDWDLWQRVARTGAPFAQTEAEVALYRSQPGSLSKNIRQLVGDTFEVIERGGRPDPRVPNPAADYALGAPGALQGRFRLNFLLWSAARQIAGGGAGADLVDLMRDRLDLDLDLDPEETGEMLAEGMADFLAVQPSQLGARWSALAPELKALLARAFPGPDRARLRDVTLLTLKNRLHAPFDDADGEAVRELRLDPAEGLQAAAGGPGAPLAAQLWRGGALGVVVRTGLATQDARSLAQSFAEQLRGLSMSDAAATRPWRSAGFWPAFLGRAAQGAALYAGAAIVRGRTPVGFVRQRLRHAFAGGLAGSLGLSPPRLGRGDPAPRPARRRGADGQVSQVPILMYHRIAADGPDALRRWRLRPDAFRRQIELLARNRCWTPTAAQLRAALDANRPLDEGAVMLTFDDGYADFAEMAWPVLREHGFTAQLFVVAGKVGGAADWDDALGRAARLLDWSALRALAAEGVEIGSHSLTHPRLTRLGLEEVRREAQASFDLIAAEIGRPPLAFAYPFGLRDPFVQQVVADCGYRLGLSCVGGPATLSSSPLKLPRIETLGGEDVTVFARKLGLTPS